MRHVSKRCSAVFFFAGRADRSPWETETVEPAFGPYHFTNGGCDLTQDFQLGFLSTSVCFVVYRKFYDNSCAEKQY